jgi:signal transduction histidine kinase
VDRWQHAIDNGEPFEMEFPLRGADGTFRWFLTRVRPLRDAEGRIVRWFGSNTNIDERRRNDDFKETFVGVLGHDLRNPLNTILTTSRLLVLLEDTPPDIRRRLERMTASGIRMQRMIEQLLDLTRARLTAGIPIALSAEEIDLAASVVKIVDEIRGASPGSLIEIRVDGDCSARIDSDRFEQVLSNLLGNAVTHGDPTRPIRVTLRAGPAAIVLTVQNQGPPIDPEFLPLLFNPFARGGKPLGRSAGLGLGLYISERIVDAHHGTLSAQSSSEAGTTFTVTVPKRPISGGTGR